MKRTVIASTLIFLALPPVFYAQGNAITVTTAATYQTIQGWEATIQAGHGSAYWNNVRNALLAAVLDDAGITRVRLEVTPGSESPSVCSSGPCEAVVNDNSDPFSLNAAGFNWARLDGYINNVLVPLRALAAGRGKTIYANLCYVSFSATAASLHATNAQEYAEFMEATFMHMSSAFGFVPDAVEIILEPDNTGGKWDGTRIGNAIVAAGARLAAHGWRPDFIGPSPANADGTYMLGDMMAVPGVGAYLKEISFHRYGGVGGGASTYVSTAQGNGKRVGMLEYGPATITELLYDLRHLSVNAWQMEGISFNFSSQSSIDGQEGGFGANYFYILDASPGSIQMSKRTAELRQVMRYAPPGAVRVEATSNFGSVPADSVVAFRNPDGNIVVVQQAPFGGASWSVAGLPAGTYGLTYSLTQGGTCPNSCPQVTLGDQTIGTGGVVSASLPSAGTLTVFGKTTSALTPPPPAAPTSLRLIP